MNKSFNFRELRNKENKTEVEWELLKYYYAMCQISEILVDESKMHIESDYAVDKIRKILNSNL